MLDIHVVRTNTSFSPSTRYDSAKAAHAPEFEQHISRVHDKWLYVLFISFLLDKDPTEYNGLESYVAKCLATHDLSWIPDRKSSGLRVVE